MSTRLAARLQSDGAKSFVDSWNDLMAHIDQQSVGAQRVMPSTAEEHR